MKIINIFAVFFKEWTIKMTKKGNFNLPTSPESGNVQAKLQFLTDFMQFTGDSGAYIAKVLGMTRGSVSHWITTDDMKLSYCDSYIRSRKYSLIFELIPHGEKRASVVTTEISPIETARRTRRKSRLSFLSKAMKEAMVTKTDVANALDICYNTVRHWFVVDDIYISHIYAIAFRFGMDIKITVRPRVAEAGQTKE